MNVLVWAYPVLILTLLALAAPGRRSQRAGFLIGHWVTCALVATAAVPILATGAVASSSAAHLAILPGFGFTLDPLRAFFLLIAASVYALSVTLVARDSQRFASARARLILAFTTLLFAGMITVLVAAGITSLIFAWEIMSLSLVALVFLGGDSAHAVRAGFLTLVLSEAGALAALAGLLLLGNAAGTWSLAGIAEAAAHMPPGIAWAGFLLTFFGFGVKTGILPVNIWMGDGYAAAPRGVLPIFSGATLNLGVLTLWVIDGPLAMHHPAIALVMLATGALTAILGIIYALATHSLTRLLTQSSIENLGIVVAASGAGFAFCALGHPVLGSLSLVAGLYHMLNHSSYKTLLFLGAAAIGEATNTDDLNRMGGLMRRVPLFGTLFLFGAFAIASLPPLNGFVSEWLVLQSLLRVVELSSIPARIVFALSGALLALTAGLAVTCFVMLPASALLGLPRSNAAAHVRRMPRSATIPMGILLAACLALGILATGVIPLLGRLVGSLTGADATGDLVPAFLHGTPDLAAGLVDDLTQLGVQIGRGLIPLRGLVILHSGGADTPVVYAMSTTFMFIVLALLLFLTWLLARKLHDHHRVMRRTLWDAGLVRLQREMTYTATAFAAPVRVIFDKILRPVVAERVERQGAFITARHREGELIHIVDRLTLRPLVKAGTWIAAQLARMHHGPVTLYAGYILAVLAATLLAAAAGLD
ncbi:MULTISPECIES: proton-conducting transporter transmembrane domain-containing protein [Alcaligenaceae]|uniref:Hydrogenase-4 component B n=1 Tax=Eoetvoesiella caeni TaxID=645616 RepID=A0A366H652_9BURK|nr:proton-conducting transporter membrane subunit [Eoetvoesiella caeni]MCI2810338.1 hypothetical protein [Eoetvoesiella caeni]NYT54707.1 hypothetical protein [Eoetvoesiella caeni]RBP37124.1 hydrogenase-4 component B [Eoetvoesiella caeni]